MLNKQIKEMIFQELLDKYRLLRHYEDSVKYDTRLDCDTVSLYDIREDIRVVRGELLGMVSVMKLSGILGSDVSVREMYSDFTFISGNDMKPIFPVSSSYRLIEYCEGRLSPDYFVTRLETSSI